MLKDYRECISTEEATPFTVWIEFVDLQWIKNLYLILIPHSHLLLYQPTLFASEIIVFLEHQSSISNVQCPSAPMSLPNTSHLFQSCLFKDFSIFTFLLPSHFFFTSNVFSIFLYNFTQFVFSLFSSCFYQMTPLCFQSLLQIFLISLHLSSVNIMVQKNPARRNLSNCQSPSQEGKGRTWVNCQTTSFTAQILQINIISALHTPCTNIMFLSATPYTRYSFMSLVSMLSIKI